MSELTAQNVQNLQSMGTEWGVAASPMRVVDDFGFIDGGSSLYRDAGKPPSTVIFHSKHNQIVDPVYCLKLRDALRTHGIVHEHHVYDDALSRA